MPSGPKSPVNPSFLPRSLYTSRALLRMGHNAPQNRTARSPLHKREAGDHKENGQGSSSLQVSELCQRAERAEIPCVVVFPQIPVHKQGVARKGTHCPFWFLKRPKERNDLKRLLVFFLVVFSFFFFFFQERKPEAMQTGWPETMR